jgi:hypothetical protein
MEDNMSGAVKIIELEVKTNEVEGKRFYYFDLGGKRNIKRIWINSLYFEEELKNKLGKNEIIGILKNARIEKTSKGNHVIKKGTNNIFFILAKCGYRGTSNINVLTEYTNLVSFEYYHSENGRLGISDGVVIETQKDYVKIEWYRTGRLYGEPDKGIAIVKIDGTIESLDLLNEELEQI